MKKWIAILSIGVLGSFILMTQPVVEMIEKNSDQKTVRYTAVNNQELAQLEKNLMDLSSQLDGSEKNRLQELASNLQVLKRPTSLTVEFHSPQTRSATVPLIVLWASLFISMILTRNAFKKDALVTTKNKRFQSQTAFELKQFTDHLLNPAQVEGVIGSLSNTTAAFKDFNQTIAELSLRMNQICKLTGKFLDVDLKSNLSDCFVESDRLEAICREFLLGCHAALKEQERTQGMYVRTDEADQKYLLGCFIPDLSEADLMNGALARDILHRFAALESKYSLNAPMINVRSVTLSDVTGIDFTLSFENKSQMEELSHQTFATI